MSSGHGNRVRRLRLATAGTEGGIWRNAAPATGAGMQDRLSQQKIEHEANAVGNEDGERRPGDGRHTAPRCIRVNIAREKKISGGKGAARQTDQGTEGDGTMMVEGHEEEDHKG